MKNHILLACSLMVLGGMNSAARADDLTIDQKLSQTTAKVNECRQAGRLSVKDATEFEKEATKLSQDMNESRNKNKGTLSKGDETKYCNRVKAFEEKVSRAAYPQRTSDEQALAKVRKAILDQKGLSTEAQNVKLSFEGSTLVLDGPVKSEEEKAQLINIAKETGVAQVDCKLSVTQ